MPFQRYDACLKPMSASRSCISGLFGWLETNRIQLLKSKCSLFVERRNVKQKTTLYISEKPREIILTPPNMLYSAHEEGTCFGTVLDKALK